MWYTGRIPEGIINDTYKFLQYEKEPFNDTEAIEEWLKIYGDIFDTGEMADFRKPQPDWTNKVAEFLKLNLCGTTFYKMAPGKILPYHSDAYKKYIAYHNIENVKTIHRAIIFLEDWKPGHIFEIDGYPIVNYRAGTYVVWNYDTPHMAANLGPDFRYTLQITGIIENVIS